MVRELRAREREDSGAEESGSRDKRQRRAYLHKGAILIAGTDEALRQLERLRCVTALTVDVRPRLALRDQPSGAANRAIVEDDASEPQRPLDKVVSGQQLGFEPFLRQGMQGSRERSFVSTFGPTR